MLLARPLRRSSALAVAVLLLTGCSHVPLASDVHRRLGVGRYAALPADSVRVVELRRAPGWQAQLADSVGGPYEVLAAVRTLGAGGDAAADARAAFRRRVGEVGGNVAALLAVEKEPATPYTHAEGDAVRALPPMPDASLRCDRLDAPDSAGARVVACREASRLAPSDPSPLRALAVAHLALAQRATARRQEGLAIQSARGEAAIAAYRAGRLDPAYAAPAPYLPGAVALFGGDSLRAYQALAILLGGGPGVLSPAAGALAANREGSGSPPTRWPATRTRSPSSSPSAAPRRRSASPPPSPAAAPSASRGGPAPPSPPTPSVTTCARCVSGGASSSSTPSTSASASSSRTA